MTDTTSRPSSVTMLAMVVVGVLLLAVLVAVAGGSDEPASGFDPASITTPTIDGDAVLTGATGVPAPRVLADALLSEGQAQVPVPDQATMIVFLAHWCPHCNDEVPVVTDWLATDPLPDRVELRAVATGIDETLVNYPPDTWLRERRWVTPTLVDVDNSIAAAYGVDSYPYWVFVDADGTVVGSAGAQDAASLSAVAAQLDPDA